MELSVLDRPTGGSSRRRHTAASGDRAERLGETGRGQPLDRRSRFDRGSPPLPVGVYSLASRLSKLTANSHDAASSASGGGVYPLGRS